MSRLTRIGTGKGFFEEGKKGLLQDNFRSAIEHFFNVAGATICWGNSEQFKVYENEVGEYASQDLVQPKSVRHGIETSVQKESIGHVSFSPEVLEEEVQIAGFFRIEGEGNPLETDLL